MLLGMRLGGGGHGCGMNATSSVDGAAVGSGRSAVDRDWCRVAISSLVGANTGMEAASMAEAQRSHRLGRAALALLREGRAADSTFFAKYLDTDR